MKQHSNDQRQLNDRQLPPEHTRLGFHDRASRFLWRRESKGTFYLSGRSGLTGSGFFGISPRLPLRICRPVQSGNCRESATRRVKQSFTARAKLTLQLLRHVMQLSIIVSD